MTGRPVKPSRQVRNWHHRLARLSPYAKAAVLCGALLICGVPLLSIALFLNGPSGVIAASIACAVCLVSGLNGLVVATYLERRMGSYGVMSSMLAGMLIRMGMPLLLLLAMVIKSHPLLDSGFAYYLIAFYQAMLFVEVILIAPRNEPAVAKA